MIGPARAVAAVAAALLLAPSCQLVDEGATRQPAGEAQTAADAAALLGNPREEFPSTLEGLLEHTRPEALTWQDDPVLADVTVWLAPDGTWERTRLTWVAADADRMLTVRAAPDELRLERPRLEGLQLLELPAEAIQAIPPLPDDVLEPHALGAAAAEALSACDAGETVRAVLYATGAPAAWDGEAWSVIPSWRATVVTDAAGVTVDPTDGTPFAPLTCLEPLLLAQE